MIEAKQTEAAPTASFWRDPDKRAIVYQVVVVAVVGWLIYSMISNTATNMEARGLATGFRFLDTSAGFGIISTPFVEYSEASSYFTVFLVGLVNTIIVAFIGCILALFLGFIVGIARLSSNWLVQKIATAYIEFFRNVPLLLQILFWYSAVLKPLPGPRELHEAGESVFFSINNRGLIFAEPVGQPGFEQVWYAFFAAIVLAWLIAKWAAFRQTRTGKQFPVFIVSALLIIGVPLIVLPIPICFPYLPGQHSIRQVRQ